VIIRDLDIRRMAISPPEADSPLLVDPDAVLALPVTLESLEPVSYTHLPPAPPFPEHLHNKKMCGVVWCYTGPLKQAERVFEPIRRFKTPALDFVGPIPHPVLQSMHDGLYPPGHQWYWKADFVRTLPDEAIAVHVKYAESMPSMQSTMHLYPINGAAGRVKNSATPWAYRLSLIHI